MEENRESGLKFLKNPDIILTLWKEKCKISWFWDFWAIYCPYILTILTKIAHHPNILICLSGSWQVDTLVSVSEVTPGIGVTSDSFKNPIEILIGIFYDFSKAQKHTKKSRIRSYKLGGSSGCPLVRILTGKSGYLDDMLFLSGLSNLSYFLLLLLLYFL